MEGRSAKLMSSLVEGMVCSAICVTSVDVEQKMIGARTARSWKTLVQYGTLDDAEGSSGNLC